MAYIPDLWEQVATECSTQSFQYDCCEQLQSYAIFQMEDAQDIIDEHNYICMLFITCGDSFANKVPALMLHDKSISEQLLLIGQ